MKAMQLIILICLLTLNGHAQETSPEMEQQTEALTRENDAEPEDDNVDQELELRRRRPINLNRTDAAELERLTMLSALQIEQFLKYRALLGAMIDLCELQAVPGWDLATIRLVIPYVTVREIAGFDEQLMKRMHGGEHSLLLRLSGNAEQPLAYEVTDSNESKFAGSPYKLFFRYRYSFKDLLQFGLTGDKDAGETFFRGSSATGFDFYSAHLFIRKLGRIKALAIGDYSVNMGQGLILWQSMAFKKSADAMLIKKQSPVLKAYNSAGEYNFQRGLAMTTAFGKLETTIFASRKKISTTVGDPVPGPEPTGEGSFSSIQQSGYHRTASEISDRFNTTMSTTGAVLRWPGQRWSFALNGIITKFSREWHKNPEPYNLYAIQGDHWFNASIDYGYTWQNMHFFGELATDTRGSVAALNGLLISLNRYADLSILWRSIEPAYQAIAGNAFTENSTPSNEHGFYTGLSVRPTSSWKLDLYMDVYQFPWIRYQVDAPSSGRDGLIQVTWIPQKTVEVYSAIRVGVKEHNVDAEGLSDPPDNIDLPGTNRPLVAIDQTGKITQSGFRMQVRWQINPALAIRLRSDFNQVRTGIERAEGTLLAGDVNWSPGSGRWKLSLRLQLFNTDDYASRIYAFESDVLYSHSIPVWYGNGYRYYLLCNRSFGKKITAWMKLARTVYPAQTSIGTGLSEVNANHQTSVTLQIRFLF